MKFFLPPRFGLGPDKGVPKEEFLSAHSKKEKKNARRSTEKDQIVITIMAFLVNIFCSSSCSYVLHNFKDHTQRNIQIAIYGQRVIPDRSSSLMCIFPFNAYCRIFFVNFFIFQRKLARVYARLKSKYDIYIPWNLHR